MSLLLNASHKQVECGRDRLRAILFYELRYPAGVQPKLSLRRASSKSRRPILVAGESFGCGSSRGRGHLPVFRSGQRRGVTRLIKRQLRRRSAVEPLIGHMKEDGRLGGNFLGNRRGDRLNAILAGVDVRLLLRWFQQLLCLVLGWLYHARSPRAAATPEPRSPPDPFLTNDCVRPEACAPCP